MSAEPRLIPTSSQTVGPFFRIGLEYLTRCAPSADVSDTNRIIIRGRVLDRDRAPVPDAMLEFWFASGSPTNANSDSARSDIPADFRRVATGSAGDFCVQIAKPAPIPFDGNRMQAPHMVVLVFARGLLRHLISRVYFDGDAGNDFDPVLLGIPGDRRQTLIGQSDGQHSFRWDVVLQGTDETVFFAW